MKVLPEDMKKPKIQLQGEAAVVESKSKKVINLLENKPKVDITS